jgi:hypothetical protein
MTQAAIVVLASIITPSRSYRTRSRRPFIRPIVRSSTDADLPQPAAVGHGQLGDVRLDHRPPPEFPRALLLEPRIGVRLVGQLMQPPWPSIDLRKVEDQRGNPAVVAGIGPVPDELAESPETLGGVIPVGLTPPCGLGSIEPVLRLSCRSRKRAKR